MDFARPLVASPSVVSQSRIRYLEPLLIDVAAIHANDCPDVEEGHFEAEGAQNATTNTTIPTLTTTTTLDNHVIAAANQAAHEFFFGHGLAKGASSDEKEKLLNASLYTERSTPIVNGGRIQAGDLVVIQESFDKLDFVYVRPGDIFQNRNGAFHHNDFMNQPFGTKVRSRDLQGYGFIFLLKPTPELWTRSLNHRTQVVHELDQAQIVWQLHLQPNHVVVESGTGSGAMSHSILRTIAPSGHLHTYEFNKHRAESAQQEFQQHGLQHLVTVHHKDVCRGLTEVEDVNADRTKGGDTDDKMNGSGNEKQQNLLVQTGNPGFDLPGQSVDAVFLDLPEPWWAVPHAAYALKANARIASYSPCVEQTQKTIQSLEACGFHSIKTFEYRLMEHYVDEVDYELPPCDKRPRPEPHDVASYEQIRPPMVESGEEEEAGRVDLDGSTVGVDLTRLAVTAIGNEYGSNEDGVTEANDTTAQTKKDSTPNADGKKRKKTMLVARPFVMMRGHSAFLTFATAGLLPQPDPNQRRRSSRDHTAAGAETLALVGRVLGD